MQYPVCIVKWLWMHISQWKTIILESVIKRNIWTYLKYSGGLLILENQLYTCIENNKIWHIYMLYMYFKPWGPGNIFPITAQVSIS